jgi:hypothetical protein
MNEFGGELAKQPDLCTVRPTAQYSRMICLQDDNTQFVADRGIVSY